MLRGEWPMGGRESITCNTRPKTGPYSENDSVGRGNWRLEARKGVRGHQ